MPWNIPILLTWMRVLLIPVFTLLFYLPKGWLDPQTINWTAVFIFAAAAVTDWFDGFLARRWKQTSDFGAFLDPVADKLMVAVALILLVSLHRRNHHLRTARMDGTNGQTRQRGRRPNRQIENHRPNGRHHAAAGRHERLSRPEFYFYRQHIDDTCRRPNHLVDVLLLKNGLARV